MKKLTLTISGLLFFIFAVLAWRTATLNNNLDALLQQRCSELIEQSEKHPELWEDFTKRYPKHDSTLTKCLNRSRS